MIKKNVFLEKQGVFIEKFCLNKNNITNYKRKMFSSQEKIPEHINGRIQEIQSLHNQNFIQAIQYNNSDATTYQQLYPKLTLYSSTNLHTTHHIVSKPNNEPKLKLLMTIEYMSYFLQY